MILNKSNLLVSLLADKSIPILGNIKILSDGTTIASNGRAILFVEGVPDGTRKSLTLKESPGKEVILPVEAVSEILKGLPKDNLFKGLLEHVDIAISTDGEVEVITTDGKRNRILKFKMYLRKWVDYKEILLLYRKQKKVQTILLNRKRLLGLLETIDKICPDSSGEDVVAIEIGDKGVVTIRGENRRTGQSVFGIMTEYLGEWKRNFKWESQLFRSSGRE